MKHTGVRLPSQLRAFVKSDLSDAVLKTTIPKLAKNPQAIEAIEESLLGMPTEHRLYLGMPATCRAFPMGPRT